MFLVHHFNGLKHLPTLKSKVIHIKAIGWLPHMRDVIIQ